MELVIVVLLIIIIMLIGKINLLQENLIKMNSTINKIASKLGIEEKGEVYSLKAIIEDDSELLNMIKEGKKIKAIKKIRNITGIGLKEAKEFVDKYEV
ncbi:ribosomal protein L7/L12 [Clostridium paraputrificum]|uniref:ribosomal protein L7/L12 n=1 Tax=Clostridium TaxID=1485 RepID=UPI003D34AB95